MKRKLCIKEKRERERERPNTFSMGQTAAATTLWWAVENLCIWAPCCVTAALFPVPAATATFAEQWWFYCASGAITIEGGFLLQHILVHTVFAGTPRFATGGAAHPRDGWHTGMVDFAKVMLPALTAGSLVFTALVRCFADDPLLEVTTLPPPPLDPPKTEGFLPPRRPLIATLPKWFSCMRVVGMRRLSRKPHCFLFLRLQ